MIDFILAAVSAGLLAFLGFFLVSFAILSLFTGIANLTALFLRHLMEIKALLFGQFAA